MGALKPMPAGGEQLAPLLKEAQSPAEYQRVQCVWLRVTLGPNASQIDHALGWQTSSGPHVKPVRGPMSKPAFCAKGKKRSEIDREAPPSRKRSENFSHVNTGTAFHYRRHHRITSPFRRRKPTFQRRTCSTGSKTPLRDSYKSARSVSYPGIDHQCVSGSQTPARLSLYLV
jgi:hypothetical protein